MRWELSQLAFEILDDYTDDPVVTARINTPAGEGFVMARSRSRTERSYSAVCTCTGLVPTRSEQPTSAS
jgi:hypothetical protein